MIIAIVLALSYGVLIALTRASNGRVGMLRGAFHASFLNHIVGFAFLSLILLMTGSFTWNAHAPWIAYLGGILGTFFVAINAYVIPRLGVTKSALLVVSGQMITGVLIGYKNSVALSSTVMQLCGIALILFGIYWVQRQRR